MGSEPTSETHEVTSTTSSFGSGLQGGPAQVTHYETTITTDSGQTVVGYGNSAEDSERDANHKYEEWKEDHNR